MDIWEYLSKKGRMTLMWVFSEYVKWINLKKEWVKSAVFYDNDNDTSIFLSGEQYID